MTTVINCSYRYLNSGKSKEGFFFLLFTFLLTSQTEIQPIRLDEFCTSAWPSKGLLEFKICSYFTFGFQSRPKHVLFLTQDIGQYKMQSLRGIILYLLKLNSHKLDILFQSCLFLVPLYFHCRNGHKLKVNCIFWHNLSMHRGSGDCSKLDVQHTNYG